MGDENGTTTEPRWSLIAGVTLLGALVVAAPFALSTWNSAPFGLATWVDEEFGSWRALTSSTLTNVGTALLLAAFLVWVERSFLARAEVTARQVVAEQAVEFRTTTEALRQELTSLQDRVAERAASAEAAGAAIVEEITSNVSFETVTRALELANDVDALWHSAITLPTNDTVDAPAVRLSWTAAQHVGRFDDLNNVVATLDVVYEHHPGASHQRFALVWLPGVLAYEMVHELRELMVKADYGEATRALDAEYMFERFGRGVSDAIAGKRAASDAWLRGCGQLDELVGPDLAITSLGVAARGHGLVLTVDQFPERPPMAMSAAQRSARALYKLPNPTAPSGIDPAHWAVAIARAAEHHPPSRGPGVSRLPSVGFAVTSANTPMRRE